MHAVFSTKTVTAPVNAASLMVLSRYEGPNVHHTLGDQVTVNRNAVHTHNTHTVHRYVCTVYLSYIYTYTVISSLHTVQVRSMWKESRNYWGH